MNDMRSPRKAILIPMLAGVVVGIFLGYKVLPQILPRDPVTMSATETEAAEAARLRAEARLTAAVESLAPVTRARVAVTLPPPGTRRPRPAATVTATSPAPLTRDQVDGIAVLAASELGTDASAIGVFDAEGRHLNAEAQVAGERRVFWTSIAINVAKVLGILAALITLRFIVQSIDRRVHGELDRGADMSRRTIAAEPRPAAPTARPTRAVSRRVLGMLLAGALLVCAAPTLSQSPDETAPPDVTPSLDMAALEALYTDVQTSIQEGRWETAAALAAGYAQDPDFNAHLGLSLADLILPHEPLLDVAQGLLVRCLEANSLDNLALLGAANATPRKLAMDAGRAHSALALVHLKRDEAAAADRQIELAFQQLSGPVEPLAVDWLRAGLADQGMGRSQRAWERVSRAILLDSSVELKDPFYRRALKPLVEARTGWGQRVGDYLAAWRRDHAPAAPDLLFARADGSRIRVSDLRGRALVLNFFSPVCGTCQMEIPAVGDLWADSRQNDAVEMFFVLNNPRFADRVPALFAAAGIDTSAVVTLAEGSAYDHIPGEPTVWIIDAEGRLRARHTGYVEGDEALYARELAAIAAPPGACNCGH